MPKNLGKLIVSDSQGASPVVVSRESLMSKKLIKVTKDKREKDKRLNGTSIIILLDHNLNLNNKTKLN